MDESSPVIEPILRNHKKKTHTQDTCTKFDIYHVTWNICECEPMYGIGKCLPSWILKEWNRICLCVPATNEFLYYGMYPVNITVALTTKNCALFEYKK